MYELFETIRQNVDIARNICIFFVTKQSTILYNEILSIDYQKLQFDTVFYLNRHAQNIYIYSIMIYEKYDFVARIVDSLQYTFNYLYAFVQFRKTEPFYHTWSCVSVLTNSYYNYKNFNYGYTEAYEPKLNMTLEKLSIHFSALYYHVYSIISNENSICDSLITYKYNNKYIHRIVDCDKKTFTSKNSKIIFDDSDVKFLSIEYRSKHYMRPLVLELKNEDYLVNNEILSATFVKRLLEYQIPYHEFDKNYEITILDNNLKAVYLKFGEYIKLNKTDYSVLKTSEFHEIASK
jgi:hypothetical protein